MGEGVLMKLNSALNAIVRVIMFLFFLLLFATAEHFHLYLLLAGSFVGCVGCGLSADDFKRRIKVNQYFFLIFMVMACVVLGAIDNAIGWSILPSP
jgi:hypothetical protein